VEQLNHRPRLPRSLRPLRLVTLLAGIALASGCAHVAATAKAKPEPPPLDVPAAPPRIIMPLEADVPPVASGPEEPRRPTPPAPARPRVALPAEAPKTEPPKPPETKPAEEPARPAPTAPGTALQTTPASEQGEVERGIRATLARANGDLGRIDYRALNADARAQYDTAKRFIRQTEEAIAMKNLVFAKNLADKAAALATQLRGQ
jgi:outer membrane biosynthesis protein TonB